MVFDRAGSKGSAGEDERMSDDLISRKALMEEIDGLYMSITGLRAGKGVLLKFTEEYKKSILKCIEEAPTAYDADAVIEKLEKLKEPAWDTWNAIDSEQDFGEAMAYKNAIEIVRNGGKKE